MGAGDTEVKPEGATGQSSIPSLVSAPRQGDCLVAFSSSPSALRLRMVGGDDGQE